MGRSLWGPNQAELMTSPFVCWYTGIIIILNVSLLSVTCHYSPRRVITCVITRVVFSVDRQSASSPARRTLNLPFFKPILGASRRN